MMHAEPFLRIAQGASTPFPVPALICTVAGNPKSESVIGALQVLGESPSARDRVVGYTPGYKAIVFPHSAAVEAALDGTTRNAAVAVFDSPSVPRHFTPGDANRLSGVAPDWASRVHWRVAVHPGRCAVGNCARQIHAHFGRRFNDQLNRKHFPWGPPRAGEAPPVNVVLPADMDTLLARLNDGPDYAATIASQEFARDLPTGSRISWIRVPGEPIAIRESYLADLLANLGRFQAACRALIDSRPEEVSGLLMAGVDLPADAAVRTAYLFPKVSQFSVDRPDLHYETRGLAASEIDEMPGGFPLQAHLDWAYGVNGNRWERCFRWLTERGTLLFVVSDNWSWVYLDEFGWFATFLAERGYPVKLITTSQLERLTIGARGVTCDGEPVGTVWRQFPVFETMGRLAELVLAADAGVVRMVPEFGMFGNKTLFALFTKYREFFASHLDPATLRSLGDTLPESHLVLSVASFPITINLEGGPHAIESLADLRDLPASLRDQIVMKVSGANTSAARSYGVLMGHGLTSEVWSSWVSDRLAAGQPFVLQRRFATTAEDIPLLNTKSGNPELFRARLLLRPWVVGGQLVSGSVCAVPASTLKVHGMVHMAEVPLVFEP